MPLNTILLGDAAERLRELGDRSVDCIVTSPPYFRLRDYGVPGQLGLEAQVDEWVANLVRVFDEAARVLTTTGSLWLNLGDSFSTHPAEGAGRKSLLLAPERLALELVSRGWLLRNKIVWAKPNTTPTSVRDRLATKHEFIYLFVRAPKYYFDLDAIREPHTSHRTSTGRPSTAVRPERPAWLGPNSDGDGGLATMHRAGITGHPLGKNPGDVWRIAVSSYRGAHFATYPERLVERILLAGCPESRCSVCRLPWTRPLQRHGLQAKRLSSRPSCQCGAVGEAGVVVDPFLGSGTTAVVAERLGRSWIGIELSPEFHALAESRIDARRVSGEAA